MPYFPCCTDGDVPTVDQDLGWGKFCLPQAGGSTLTSLAQNAVALTGMPDSARLFGMSFSPFTLGRDITCRPVEPLDSDSFCASPAKVESDLRIIRAYTRRLRTYSMTCEDASFATLKFAKENGMQVMLGIWISKDTQQNADELVRLKKALEEYGDIVSHVVVGNEPVFILEVVESTLAKYIRDVKAIFGTIPADKVPKGGVGTADIYNVSLSGAFHVFVLSCACMFTRVFC